jgi:hypothetical protein
LAERKLGRERELAADAIAAHVTTARHLGTALLKVCAFAPLWDGVYEHMREAIAQGQQFINISFYWADAVSHMNDPAVFAGIDTRHLSHPTDSHPPLGLRLDALKLSTHDLTTESLSCDSKDSAIELIASHEDLEKELTDVEHALLARSLPASDSGHATGTPTEGSKRSTTGQVTLYCRYCRHLSPAGSSTCSNCGETEGLEPQK